MNSNGGDPYPLYSSGPNEYEFAPHFVPDGKEVYFAKAVPSTPVAGAGSASESWELYSASLDGKNIQPVTDRQFRLFRISFSQDNRKLVVAGEGTDGTQMLLYSLDNPDKNAAAIRPRIPTASQRAEISDVTLAPDGQHIYFMAAIDGKKGFDYDVYRADLAGNNVEKLTSANGYATDLCLSSDGKTAAFLRWTSRWGSTPNFSRLYKLDLSTRRLTPLNVTGTQ